MDKITLIGKNGREKIVPVALYNMMPAHKYGLQVQAVTTPPKAIADAIKTKPAKPARAKRKPDNNE